MRPRVWVSAVSRLSVSCMPGPEQAFNKHVVSMFINDCFCVVLGTYKAGTPIKRLRVCLSFSFCQRGCWDIAPMTGSCLDEKQENEICWASVGFAILLSFCQGSESPACRPHLAYCLFLFSLQAQNRFYIFT